MDDDWTTTVTQQIGVRLKRVFEVDINAITPAMADRLERLKLAEEHSLTSPAPICDAAPK